MMEVQVKEWGNSQGVRLSKAIMQEAGIRMNDYLQVEAHEGKIILSKAFHHKTLAERIQESGKPLTSIGEYDWGEPQGNEVW